MSENLREVNRIYQSVHNLFGVTHGLRTGRYIDGDLAKYAKTILKIRHLKSTGGAMNPLDEVIIFHSSLKNALTIDPFHPTKHEQLLPNIQRIPIDDIANGEDLIEFEKLITMAKSLISRTLNPGFEFLENLIDLNKKSVLITFLRESTRIKAEGIFSDKFDDGVRFDSQSRRSDQSFDVNVIFGPLHWYSESVVTNPKGFEIKSVSAAHIAFKPPELISFPSWFNYGKKPTFTGIDAPMLLVQDDKDDTREDHTMEFPIYWARNNSYAIKTQEGQELCRQFALANGKQVFVQIDGGDLDFVNVVSVDSQNQLTQSEISPRSIGVGNFVVLREGQSDSEALLLQAASNLGNRYAEIEENQQVWKSTLQASIDKNSLGKLSRDLVDLGLKSENRIRDWVKPSLRRPLRDEDFRILLKYLGLNINKYYESATLLRRTILQAAMEFRHQLEKAINDIPVENLLTEGTVVIKAPVNGIANLFVSRIVGVSPIEVYVDRQKIRIPFESVIGR
jgi:hypothetical protein